MGNRNPCGSTISQNVTQLNPDEDKYYLLTPYPTLMQPLKTFSPESIRAFARNPNIDLQSIGKHSKSAIQHHMRTQQFQELLTKMENTTTIHRSKLTQTCRNSRLFKYLRTRLQRIFQRYKRLPFIKWQKIQTTRYITNKKFLFCKFEKLTSCLSRMALLHLRKIDYIIRNT